MSVRLINRDWDCLPSTLARLCNSNESLFIAISYVALLLFRAAVFRSLFNKAAAGRAPCRSQLRLTLPFHSGSDVSRVASYLERQSSGDLEGARPAGAECLANPLVRFPECSRAHKVEVEV